MADVGTLRAVLTANIADFKRGFQEAAVATDKLDESSKKLRNNVVPITQALTAVQSKGPGAAAAIGGVSANASRLTAAIEPATASAAALGKNITALGVGAGLTGSRVLSLVSAVGPLDNLLGALQEEDPASTIVNFSSALVGFSPIAIAGALAVATLNKEITAWTKDLAKQKAKIDDFTANAAKGIKQLGDIVIDIKFEASIAGLTALEQETARGAEAIRRIGAEHGVAQGQIDATVAAFQRERSEIVFLQAAAESQDAGRKLSDEIRAGAESALEAIAKLKAGFGFEGAPSATSLALHLDPTAAQVDLDRFVATIHTEGASLPSTLDLTPALHDLEALRARVAGTPIEFNAESALASFRSLASELNFQGPLSEVAALSRALQDNAAKVRELGKQAGFSEEFIRKEVAETTAIIKRRFQEDQKLAIHLDPSAAAAELDRFLGTIGAKPATLTAKFDLSQAIRELDVLRSKIADTPEGEFKVKLQAEASALEGKIADERANVAKGATMPIDADTSAAQAKIAQLQAQADATLANFAHGGGQVFGNAATRDDLEKTVSDAATAAAAAIKSGDRAAMAQIRADLVEFEKSFGTFFGQKTIPANIEAAISAILGQVKGGFGTLSTDFVGGIKAKLSAATAEFQKAQAEAAKQAAESAATAATTASTKAADTALGRLGTAAEAFASRTFAGPTFKPQITTSPAVPFRQWLEADGPGMIRKFAGDVPELVFPAKIEAAPSTRLPEAQIAALTAPVVIDPKVTAAADSIRDALSPLTAPVSVPVEIDKKSITADAASLKGLLQDTATAVTIPARLDDSTVAESAAKIRSALDAIEPKTVPVSLDSRIDADIAKIEASIRPLAAPVAIPIGLDSTTVGEGIAKAASALDALAARAQPIPLRNPGGRSAPIGDSLRRFANPVVARLGVDDSSVSDSLTRVRQQLGAIATPTVAPLRIDADTSGVGKVADAIEAARRSTAAAATIQVDTLDRASEGLDAIAAQARHLSQPVTIPVSVDPDVEAGVSAVQAALGRIEPAVKVPVTVDSQVDDAINALTAKTHALAAPVEIPIGADAVALADVVARAKGSLVDLVSPRTIPLSIEKPEIPRIDLPPLPDLQARVTIAAPPNPYAALTAEFDRTRGRLEEPIRSRVALDTRALRDVALPELAPLRLDTESIKRSIDATKASLADLATPIVTPLELDSAGAKASLADFVDSARGQLSAEIDKSGFVASRTSAPRFGTGPAGFDAGARGLVPDTEKQNRTNELLEQTTKLLERSTNVLEMQTLFMRESQDVERAQLGATRELATGFKSGAFATDMLKQQQDAARLTGATR